MIVNEVSHPSSQRWPFTWSSIVDKSFHAFEEYVHLLTHLDAAFHSSLNFIENSFIISFSKQNLEDRQFFNDRWAFSINIRSKIKFFLDDCIFFVCPFKVLPQFGDGNVKVNVIVFMKDSGNQVNQNGVCTILVRCKLYLHCPELYPPSDLIINRYF